jgi:adenine/guanine phosphoribosyltransferase-like PRPP-binding protein
VQERRTLQQNVQWKSMGLLFVVWLVFLALQLLKASYLQPLMSSFALEVLKVICCNENRGLPVGGQA